MSADGNKTIPMLVAEARAEGMAQGAAGCVPFRMFPDPFATCVSCERLISEAGLGMFIGSRCLGVMAGGHPDESTRVPDTYTCKDCQHKQNLIAAVKALNITLCDICRGKIDA